MATILYLRNTASNGIGNFYDANTTAGSSVTTGVVNTTASGTNIQWTRTAGGTVLEWISGKSPVGGWTLSGAFTASIWAQESNMLANIGGRLRLYHRTTGGVETELGGSPWDDGVEFGTSAAEMTWSATPTSKTFLEDERLVIRFFITNVGTMASGYTGTISYNAADATTGDSFLQINENVTFKPDLASGTLTKTLGTATSSAAGKVQNNAALSKTLGTATSSAAGKVQNNAALSQTLGSATLSSAGSVPAKGTLSRALGSATLSAVGIIPSGPLTTEAGDYITTEASDGLVTEDYVFTGVTGTLSKTLGVATGNSDGKVAVVGSVSKTLGVATSSSDGKVAVAGSVSKTLGVATSSSDGKVAVVGVASNTLGVATPSSAAKVRVAGTTTKTLGAAGLQAVMRKFWEVQEPAATTWTEQSNPAATWQQSATPDTVTWTEQSNPAATWQQSATPDPVIWTPSP